MKLIFFLNSLLFFNFTQTYNSFSTNLDSPEFYQTEYVGKSSTISFDSLDRIATDRLLINVAAKLKEYKEKIERRSIIPMYVWELIDRYGVHPEKQLMFSRAIVPIYDDFDEHNIEHVHKFLCLLTKAPADQMFELSKEFPALMHVLREPFQPSIIYMSQYFDQFTKDYEEIAIQMFLYIASMVGSYPNCTLIQGTGGTVTKGQDAHDILMLIYLNLMESRFPCGVLKRMTWQDFNHAQKVVSLIALDPAFTDLSVKSEYVSKLDAILQHKNYDRSEVLAELEKPETEKAQIIDECYANL